MEKELRMFFFGNGDSRKEFNIDKVQDLGMTVGFNYAYDEYPFDLICSADLEVSSKIRHKWSRGWIRRDKRTMRDTVFYTEPDEEGFHKTFKELDGSDKVCDLFIPNYGMGWNTGRAGIYACILKYKPSEIWLFGFDMDSTSIYGRYNTAKRPAKFETHWNRIFWDNECVKKVVRVGPFDEMTPLLKCKSIAYEDLNDELSRD